MDTTIDTLKIEIQADTSKASKNIEDLQGKLSSLKTTVNKTIHELKSLAGVIDKLPTKKDITINTKTVEASSKGVKNKTASVSKEIPKTAQKVTSSEDVDVNITKANKLAKLKEKLSSKLHLDIKEGSGFDKVNKKINELKKKIDSLSKGNKAPKIDLGMSSDTSAKKLGGFKIQLRGLPGMIALIAKGATKAGGALLKLGGKAVKTGISGVKTLFTKTANGVGKLKDAAVNTASRIGKGFSNLAKRLGFVTLAAAGVRGAFTALRKAADAYMQRDEDMQKQLQNNWGVLGSLLAPIIQNIINLFTKAVSYIAAFIKALTGIDLVARANAKALNKQSSAAKKSAKELGNLASFDDLHEVKFKDDKSSGKTLDPLKVDNIDEEPFNTFIEKIKSKDWYGLGMEIGKSINEGLSSINWDDIIAKAQYVGTSVADLLNGLTMGINWELIGSTVANGLNTIMTGVNSFFEQYNFAVLGDSIARGLNSAMENLDWSALGILLTNKLKAQIEFLDAFATFFDFKKLGKNIGASINAAVKNVDLFQAGRALANSITGLIETGINIISTIDFGAIGDNISDGLINFFSTLGSNIKSIDWGEFGETLWNQFVDLVTNIDWKGIADALFDAFGAALGAAAKVIGTIVSHIIDGIKNYFKKYIDEAKFGESGHYIIEGLFNGIKDAIAAVGQWIYDHIFKPFINGFKDAFGIHSPSKVMAEMGGYIVDGLKNGLKNLWDKIKSIFTDFKDKIKESFENLKEKLVEIFEKIKYAITHPFETMKSVVTTVVDKAKSTFDKLRDKITGVFDKIKDTIGGFKDKFKEVFEGLWDIAKKPLNWIIDGVNKMIGGINKIQFDIPDWVPKIGGQKWGFNIATIPKLATGTNRIEAEGLYHLHKDEAVVPKKYNPAVNNQSYNEANSAMLAKVDKLINILDNMETTNVFNVDGDEVSRSVQKRVNRQNSIYGTNAIKV